jgi:hypothetical protein
MPSHSEAGEELLSGEWWYGGDIGYSDSSEMLKVTFSLILFLKKQTAPLDLLCNFRALMST